MTAEALFKMYDFVKVQSPSHLILFKLANDEYNFGFTVGFNISSKLYYASGNNESSVGICLGLHEAITQQMKELGWI